MDFEANEVIGPILIFHFNLVYMRVNFKFETWFQCVHLKLCGCQYL